MPPMLDDKLILWFSVSTLLVYNRINKGSHSNDKGECNVTKRIIKKLSYFYFTVVFIICC